MNQRNTSGKAAIFTSAADVHRPGGRFSARDLQAHLVRHALLFDRVYVPDAQALQNEDFRTLLDNKATVVPGLLADGGIRVSLRNTATSIEGLRRDQKARGVESVPGAGYANRLTSLCGNHVERYFPDRVSAVFKERVLDAVVSATDATAQGGRRSDQLKMGVGGVAEHTLRAFEDFVHSQEVLYHKDVRSWLLQDDRKVSERSRRKIDELMSDCYRNNVAIAHEYNFDADPAPHAKSAEKIKRIEAAVSIPGQLSCLSSLDSLADLNLDVIRDVRASKAFTQCSQSIESARLSGQADIDYLTGALEDLARQMNASIQTYGSREAKDRWAAMNRRKDKRNLIVATLGSGLALLGIVAGDPTTLEPSTLVATGLGMAGLATALIDLGMSRRDDPQEILRQFSGDDFQKTPAVLPGYKLRKVIYEDEKSARHSISVVPR